MPHFTGEKTKTLIRLILYSRVKVSRLSFSQLFWFCLDDMGNRTQASNKLGVLVTVVLL